MSTRAELFAAKIRYLQDYHSGFMWNSNSGMASAPDISMTLKYFKDILIGILKDVSSGESRTNNLKSPGEKHVTYDSSNFPTLAYFGLYDTLIVFLHKLSDLNTGREELAKELLECLCITMIFVDECTRVDLPATVTGMLYGFGSSKLVIQEHIMATLCTSIIPVCFGVGKEEDPIINCSDDIPSIIITVLECVRDVSFHFQLIETLMMFKNNLWTDVMSVASCSDGLARIYATQLLFHYWPHLHPSPSSGHKLALNQVHTNISCGHTACKSVSNAKIATMMILDCSLAARYSERPPPLYLCHMCSQEVIAGNGDFKSIDMMLPTECIKHYCENKHCLSHDSIATVTILGGRSKTRWNNLNFTSSDWRENVSFNVLENHVIRCCLECYNSLWHVIGDLNMLIQSSPTSAWNQTSIKNTNIIVNTVVTLLVGDDDCLNSHHDNDIIPKSASYQNLFCLDGSNGFGGHGVYACKGCADNVGLQRVPRTLSHFGVWMLVTLCPPQENIKHEIASQLIAAVMSWYNKNCYLSSDEFGNRLESLKRMYLETWLQGMSKFHFKAFLSCLLPNPPPESRVKGHWDSIQPLWFHYERSLSMITCLSSYSIVTLKMWEYIIPCWMTALCENLSATDLKKLKKILNALFDKDLSPLPFQSNQIFDFVLNNLKDENLDEIENALEWLQVLCEVETFIPLTKILDIFFLAASCLPLLPRAIEEVEVSVREDEKMETLCEKEQDLELTDKERKQLFKRSEISGMLFNVESAIEAMNSSCSGSCQGKTGDDSETFLSGVNETKSTTNRINRVKSASFFRPKRLSSRHRRQQNSLEQKDKEKIKTRVPSRPTDSTSQDIKPSNSNPTVLTDEWNKCRTLACYLDMVDILYKQISLQDLPKHEGMLYGESARIVTLYNNLLSHLVEDHKKKGELPADRTLQVTVELEYTGLFFEIALDLLEYILPSESTIWPEKTMQSDWTNSVNASNNFERKKEGLKMEDFDDYPPLIRLLYRLTWLLEYYASEYLTTSHIVRSIYLICFSENTLEVMSKHNEPTMKSFHADLFLVSLWNQLQIRRSDLSRQIVPILLQCTNVLRDGFRIMTELFDAAFAAKPQLSGNDLLVEDWATIFTAIDRIQNILLFADEKIAAERSPVTHVVAYALCLVLAVLKQPNSVIYSKAKFVIDSLSVNNLQVAFRCLYHEFDQSLPDRTFVLSQLLHLHQLRPDASALSFVLFSRLMDVLATEANFHSSLEFPFPFPASARSQKLNMFRVKSARASLAAYPGGNAITILEKIQQVRLIETGCLRKESNTTTMSNDIKNGLQSPIEIEMRLHHETVNHLMSVIAKYMIRCEAEMNITSTVKPFRSFLKQFHIWLGYNDQVSYFTCSPSSLRSIAGINTLMLNLPKILDYNLTLGKLLLPMVLALLEHFAKASSGNTGATSSERPQEFTLDHLSEPTRLAWLKVVHVIMYKYEISESVQRDQLLHIINICMQLLESEFHSCEIDANKSQANEEERIHNGNSNDHRSNTPTPAICRARAISKSDLILNLNQDNVSVKFIASTTHKNEVPSLVDSSSRTDCLSIDERGRLDTNRTNSSNEGFFSTNERTPLYDDLGDVDNVFPQLSRDTSYHVLENDQPSSAGFQHGKKMKNARTKNEKLEQESESKFSITTRCYRCNEVLKEFTHATLSQCVINLCHFVRFDPSLAVPSLPRVLALFARIAESLLEEKSCDHRVLSVVTMAKQSIRCVLHQLAENRIFTRLFFIPFPQDSTFIPVLIASLKGYQRLQYLDVLNYILEGLPDELGELTSLELSYMLSNLATFLHFLPFEASTPQWQLVLNNFCAFFLKLQTFIAKYGMFSVDNLFNIMTSLLEAPMVMNLKVSLLEPFAKVLSISVTSCNFSIQQLINLCSTPNDVFLKDRDKLHLTRCVASKLASVLKMNTNMSGQNLLLLLQFILLDGGSTINPNAIESLSKQLTMIEGKVTSYAMECMRTHITDCLDVLIDGNVLKGINRNDLLTRSRSNSDGEMIRMIHRSEVKLALAQIVAGILNTKQISSIFPLLYHPPTTIQHGPKEYNECLAHIKKLSWVLLGSLCHLGLQQDMVRSVWQPIPLDLVRNLSGIVQVVLTGYLEQNKEPKVNMTSLFYSFHLCQLWTIYCEQLSYYVTPTNTSMQSNSMTSPAATYVPSGENHVAGMVLLEFWNRVTPSILVLLEQDGDISKNIHRHIVSLIQCLQQYGSPTLFKLYPIWAPMLDLHQSHDSTCHPDVKKEAFDCFEYEACDFGNFCDDHVPENGRNSANKNACHVMHIVESINNKMIEIETNDWFCTV